MKKIICFLLAFMITVQIRTINVSDSDILKLKKENELRDEINQWKDIYATATEKINELTEHLKANPKDFQGRRGLLMMVGRRKNLLAYLKKVDLERYRTLIKKLNLRG